MLQSLKRAHFKKCWNTAWKQTEKLKLITKNYLINVKEGRRERTEEQEQMRQIKPNSKMSDLNMTISVMIVKKNKDSKQMAKTV